MKQGSGLTESVVGVMASPAPAPTFLVKLEPWPRAFLRNLRDFVWPRRQPAVTVSWRPAPFWPDVFVSPRLPWWRFLQSSLYHVVAFAAVWGYSQLWVRQPHTVSQPIFTREDVIYYDASEYLTPIDTGRAHLQLPQKGEPEYAPQPIISVPPEPDNRAQTIVTPPNFKLNHEVPMPNIVAWDRTQLAVPLAATARSAADLKLPALATPVIAPPPDLTTTAAQRAPALPQAVIAPPPEVNTSAVRTLRSPEPAIIEPPPSVERASTRRLGDINIGHTEVVAPAPELPIAEQRALSSRPQAALGNVGTPVVPPPPSMPAAGTSDTGGRLIALGIHPAVLTGPIEVPSGNRRGTFAATPEGKPGAPGTPDIAGSDPHPAQSGSANAHGSADSRNSKNGIPPGLFVGAGSQPVTGSAQAPGSGAGDGGSQAPSDDSRLIAKATLPRVSSIPRASEVSSNNATELEKKVFGDRKFYSMTLNMPNLNSAGGSWVVRFAELKDNGDQGELVAPVATQTVDPGYPTELMRHNVQGTVTLYAVIHSDGSVGDIRVLRGVDDRLDEYARAALSRWRFHPATRNGTAVALEAVVRIPFRPLRVKTSF
jgi:TonB family protein